MTATLREQELEALRRPFQMGMLACVAVLVCIGGIIAAFGTGADRPAGIAERWLVAVGDTTRDGIAGDARDRADHYGGVALGEPLVQASALDDGKAAFVALRVGRDLDPAADRAVIGFEVEPANESEPIGGRIELARVDGEWLVTAVTRGDPGPLDRPERAPAAAWFVGIALGCVIAVGCSVATRAASPRPRNA